MKQNRSAPGAGQRGFSLMEMLLVTVLAASAASAVVLSLSGSGPGQQLQFQSERLAAKLQLALDEAVLRGQQLGLEVTTHGYRFMVLDTASQGWHPIEHDRQLGPVTLDDNLAIELMLSGFSWGNEPPSPHHRFDDDDFYGTSSFQADSQVPQIMILSSGDYTPFEIRLWSSAEPSLAEALVSGDGLELIRLGRDEGP